MRIKATFFGCRFLSTGWSDINELYFPFCLSHKRIQPQCEGHVHGAIFDFPDKAAKSETNTIHQLVVFHDCKAEMIGADKAGSRQFLGIHTKYRLRIIGTKGSE